ncbi:7alpha-hydroxysteroid dehydrogenase [Clostridium tarantellae]|uniref:SDR family oxidoreductase n=1 Tax=Clostridium tarantellae TaxID=39493 RepID=A0A6I1MIA8_9CLOT|nr:SDR family NAD(P)-dependent oxidoreductase [Clostridium tarantellae]MPQ43296.1 SDR family oxidoreductase [Clostridium tarantellae]
MKLKNKVALVTAATKGIGLASAEKLAENGALVYIGARSEELAKEVIKSIEENGGRAKFVYFNAREAQTYTAMVEEVIENEGKIDILVNNYGGHDVKLDKTIIDTNAEHYFYEVINNLQSVFLTSQTAIKSMMKTGGGSIINISTIGSAVPDLSGIAYCTSKAAINSLTQNIAVQCAKYNIRCNAVLPGFIATKAALENMSEEFIQTFLKHVPMNRPGKPEDIANAVLFFATEDSSYLTGEIMEVAGAFGKFTPMYGDYVK